MGKVAPSTENYLYGKGSIFFKPVGGSNYMHLGNCPAFGLTVELEKAEHYSSMAGTKEKDLSKITQKTVTAAITMEELSVENMNLVLMGGTVAKVTQTGTAIADMEVTTAVDRYVTLGAMQLSNVVVSPASGGASPYTEGIDYEINREAGLFMALSTGTISTTCFLSADVSSCGISTVNALVTTTPVGELYFVGNPDIGPHWQVKGWKANLSVSGEIPFISDDISQITVSAEFVADRSGHADSPFFEAVNISN